MTFRKCGYSCLFFRFIQRSVRHMKWGKVQPVGQISWNSNKAVIKHFGTQY